MRSRKEIAAVIVNHYASGGKSTPEVKRLIRELRKASNREGWYLRHGITRRLDRSSLVRYQVSDRFALFRN